MFVKSRSRPNKCILKFEDAALLPEIMAEQQINPGVYGKEDAVSWELL